jgi:hypothetical protein
LAKDKHREKQRLAMKRNGRQRLRRNHIYTGKLIRLQKRENRRQRPRREKNGTGKKISLQRQDTVRPQRNIAIPKQKTTEMTWKM